MNTTYRQLMQWMQQGALSPEHLPEALNVTHALPTKEQQARFLMGLLLIAGTLLLISGLIFFFAFNWDDLHRLVKFAIAQLVFLVCFLPLFKVSLNHPLGQTALGAAALALGACLALVGQTYQTGADTYQLFMTWAFLLVPWLVLTQHMFLAVLIVVLSNLAIVLYSQLFNSISLLSSPFTSLALSINLLFLFLCEAYRFWRIPFGLKGLTNTLFAGLVLLMTVKLLFAFYVGSDFSLSFGPWLLLMICGFLWYRFGNLNRVCLSFIFLSLTVYATSELGHFLITNSVFHEITFLLLGGFFLGSTMLAVHYLKTLPSAREAHDS